MGRLVAPVGRLPGVAAQQIARNLAFVNWTVLAGLAIGSVASVALLRLRSEATGGYLGFTSLCAAIFGALALLSDLGLPGGTAAGSPVTVDPAWDLPRRACLAVTVAGALLAALVLLRGGRGSVLLVGLAVAGAATLVAAAFGWDGGGASAVPVALQLVVLAAAIGSSFAAMVLGHWYLVTPRLPTAPALLLSRMVLAVVSLQLVLFVTWMLFGTGPGSPPLAPLTGEWALFVWLRLLVGLVLPLAVSWAAVQTVKTRSMESATGLLYIDLGAIAAGTILAAGLYFGAGLLV